MPTGNPPECQESESRFCLGGKIATYKLRVTTGEVAHMQAKKRAQNGPDNRAEEQKAERPVGMQTMGQKLYEQIRRIVGELKLVSDN